MSLNSGDLSSNPARLQAFNYHEPGNRNNEIQIFINLFSIKMPYKNNTRGKFFA